MTDTPLFGITQLEDGQASAETTANNAFRRIESLAQLVIVDRDLSAAPTLTPVTDDGKSYLVAATPAGGDDWEGQTGNLAIYHSGWTFVAPYEGLRMFVADEDVELHYDGSAWVHVGSTLIDGSVSAAGTGEGDATQLVVGTSIVDTVAASTGVKLPAAEKGMECFIRNEGANALLVYAKTGDNIDGGASLSLPVTTGLLVRAVDATDWYSVLGA